MTTFNGTNNNDTIVPGFVSPGVVAVGPDATPGDGADVILARGGNDVVAGGLGADLAFLGAGNDIFGWAPADGSDTVFGAAGSDRLVFDGDANDERFVLREAGGEARLDRDVGAVGMRLVDLERTDLFAGAGRDEVRVGDLAGSGLQEINIDLAAVKGGAADASVDRIVFEDGAGATNVDIFAAGGRTFVLGLGASVAIDGVGAGDTLRFAAGGGDDTVSAAGIDPSLHVTLNGGAGEDLIVGGDGDDVIAGGSGRDFIAGGGGDDDASLGGGDDIFLWINGDGSDRVDGGAGDDDHAFNGFDAAEVFRLAANGSQAVLTRDLGAIRMDLVNVEGVTIRTFGGADRVEVADLTGTDVGAVEIAMSLPGRAGDGAADTVALTGGAADETIVLASGGGSLVTVRGLPADVDVFGVEAIDTLSVSAGDGDDILRAQVDAGQAQLVLDGGDGDDIVVGSDGNDVVLGGGGDDVLTTRDGDDDVFGGFGDDIGLLGAGDDVFFWDPGEGNDTVGGGTGVDTLDFDGSGSNEVIDILAEGPTAVLLRDVGAVRMDMAEVERIDLRVFAGTDEINVSDLSATALEEVVIDLGGADGAADLVTIDGTANADAVKIAVVGDAIVVSGLAATVRILGAEAGLDQLVFRGLAGDDNVDAFGLAGVAFFAQGGDGNDTISGGAAGDVLSGDAGDDVLSGAAGDDVLFGGVGDDVLDGGAGLDILTGGSGTDILINGEINADTVASMLPF